MTTLHLGVVDVSYGGKKPKTTGDVAEILEEKYHVMAKFWQVHGDDYIDDLVMGSVQALEASMTGRAVRTDVRTTLSKMQHGFRTFISSREVERVGITKVPTQAALRGVNHRRAHPYAKRNPRRPSFRDTGLYMASFRAWMT